MKEKEDEIVRIYDLEKKIIYYKEPYSTTKQQLDINFQRISDLGQDIDAFDLIIDLTKASRPTSEIRHHLYAKFDQIKSQVGHVGIFTEKNMMLNMAATFVMRKAGLKSFSIHKKLEEAEKAIEKFRK